MRVRKTLQISNICFEIYLSAYYSKSKVQNIPRAMIEYVSIEEKTDQIFSIYALCPRKRGRLLQSTWWNLLWLSALKNEAFFNLLKVPIKNPHSFIQTEGHNSADWLYRTVKSWLIVRKTTSKNDHLLNLLKKVLHSLDEDIEKKVLTSNALQSRNFLDPPLRRG